MLNLVAQFIMIYILVLIWKLSNIPTIQKPYNRSFPLPMASFVDALRPEKFSGVHFKRLYVRLAYCHGSFLGQRWLTRGRHL
jgi:hypothetical protein